MWLLFALLPLYRVNGDYSLTTAATHTLLSGSIEVWYEIPSSGPGLRVQLFQNSSDGQKPIAKRDVPQGITRGRIIFPCGSFQKAGQFVFKLLSFTQNKVLAETDAIDVRWPEITVHVPLMVETYSSNVIVQLYAGSLQCLLSRSFKTYIDLVYEAKDIWFKPTVLTTKELTNWSWDPSYDVTLECELFDRAGNYTVHVRTEFNESPLIAVSDPILVLWSHRYSVSVAKRSVQPCDGSLSVIYHYPRCILDQDRIRVYGKALRGPLKYIRESRIVIGKHATKLSCDIFQDDYQEYCFSFVSIARNGAVFDLKTHCIPTLTNGDLMATWNDWSIWSDCSTTCGTGVQTRFRLCISSTNSSNCVGRAVQSQTCKLKQCPESDKTTTEEPQILDDCPCGCERNTSERDELLLKLIVDNCDNDVVYTIHAWPSGHVIVDVHTVRFSTQDYWLTIRDDKSPLGPVLAIMTTVISHHKVHSISGAVRLEIHAANTTSIQDVEIIFSITRSEIPRESLAMVRQNVEKVHPPSNLSAVHVTIIILATVLFSTTAFLILFHICRQLRNSAESEANPAFVHSEYQTSVSELSVKTPSSCPEDYLYNSFIFRSTTSLQPKLKWDKLPPKVETTSTASPVRRRGRPIIKNAQQRESATPLTASVSELSTTGSEDGLEYDYYDYGCHQEPGSFFCPDPVLMGWPPFIPLPPQGMEEFGDYPLQNFTPSPEPT